MKPGHGSEGSIKATAIITNTFSFTTALASTDYHDNADYQIQFFFNVYAMNAEEGTTVDIDIGLVVGTTSVYANTVTLTVTAGVSPPVASGVGSWSSVSSYFVTSHLPT